MIVNLDAFSKKYYNGEGAAILLLSQVNRPSMKKLHDASKNEDKKVTIDVTCIQRFNAIYEKSTCVLVGFCDEQMRSNNRMNIYPVKLRNRPIPINPIQVPIKFEHSLIGGDLTLFEPNIEDIGKTSEELEDIKKSMFEE